MANALKIFKKNEQKNIKQKFVEAKSRDGV